MRLIHPIIFRLGNQRWNSDQWNSNQSLALIQTSITSVLQGVLGGRLNLYIMKCDLLDNVHRNTLSIGVVFYKYIQRARLVKTLRLALMIATGAFKNKPPLYYVRLSQGFMVPPTVLAKMESKLGRAFNKNFVVKIHNISQIADAHYSRLDVNVQDSIDYFLEGQQKRLARTEGDRTWPPLEATFEIAWLNPLIMRDGHYRYKSFSKLAYSLDVLMVMVYTCIYNLSNLLADTIIRGLLRNMKRHKQFLSLVRVTISHFRTFSNWPFKPFDWRIILSGKIGRGSSRSRSQVIKTGYLPLQTVSVPVDYTHRQADTKFGSIGLKIWLRRSE